LLELRDGRDVSVLEVNRLVQPAPKGDGIARENILISELPQFDLRNPALCHTHPVSDLLLGQASAASNLGKAMPSDIREHFLFAGGYGVLAPGALDMSGAHIAPVRVSVHGQPSSACRSFK
jgi:hypothetical protein